MTLVAGSYERFIWGFALNPQTQALKFLFSYPSHTGPIKSLAAAGPIAASGGSDDTIKVYDLPSSSEIGSLIEPAAAVNALAFFTSPLAPSIPRNLIAAAADGSVSIYDADPFVHLTTVNVHKKAINDLAVHPSGRLALTVAKGSSLAMVNLIRGRRSFSCKLEKEAEIVRYSELGEKFFMVSEEKIGIHEAEDAKLVFEMEGSNKVLCIAAGESGILFTAGEDKNITAWDTASGKVAYCMEEVHSTRVKGLVVFKNRGKDQTSEQPNILASASSDGVIRIWDVRMIAKEMSPLAQIDTQSRLTCLAGSSMKR